MVSLTKTMELMADEHAGDWLMDNAKDVIASLARLHSVETRHAVRCALLHIDKLENLVAAADLEVNRLERRLEKVGMM